MHDVGGIVWLVVLLLGNAFFVAGEFAVLAARRSQIEPRAERSRAARTTLAAMENVSLMLAVCQLGVTVCSLLLGTIAEPALHHLLAGPLHLAGLADAVAQPLAFALALFVVVFLHVVIGEMVPKNIALALPDRAALILAPALVFLARVLAPAVHALNALANLGVRLCGVEPKDEVTSAYTLEQVQSIVAESTREGVLDDRTGLLAGALEFSDYVARDIMVGCDRLVTVTEGTTPEQVEQLVGRTGFSRFPIVERPAGSPGDGTAPDGYGSGCDIVGYVHLKDVLDATGDDYHEPLGPRRVRSLIPVAAEDEIEDVLTAMQRSGVHLGQVVDEAGRTLGVVFLEDVLEELVGEVQDAMQSH